ncbi:MAG TPA: ligase-associated DNA damage response exonuclease [Burkholderiaceae bacterium]|nr:ligase-associated DNA damage response exonuclease [Burkholderiaceae bacterium]
MHDSDLVIARPEGLYCPAGDFHIDPWRPVDRAVITHAHADHARPGHRHYLAHRDSEGILRARLGADLPLQTLAYGQVIDHHGVRLSLHPAGHVLGSSQVRLEHQGRVWGISGDYKLEPHSTCTPFEPVRCDVFVTESTFGLPIYRWPDSAALFREIDDWWRGNAADGRPSVIFGYAFGKAQRILHGVDPSIGPIVVHGAVQTLNEVYREAGVRLPATIKVTDPGVDARRLAGALVVAPPSVQGTPWLRRFKDSADAFASGWMQVRGRRRRRGVDRGFVLSDHADWPGLNRAIAESAAERVIVTHGSVGTLVRWLNEAGIPAESFHTEYGDEDEENERASAAEPGTAVSADDAPTSAGEAPPATSGAAPASD